MGEDGRRRARGGRTLAAGGAVLPTLSMAPCAGAAGLVLAGAQGQNREIPDCGPDVISQLARGADDSAWPFRAWDRTGAMADAIALAARSPPFPLEEDAYPHVRTGLTPRWPSATARGREDFPARGSAIHVLVHQILAPFGRACVGAGRRPTAHLLPRDTRHTAAPGCFPPHGAG